MRWVFCSFHHPIYDGKKGSLIFLNFVLTFAEIVQDLAHLAHYENRQTEIFLRDRLKILIAFCYIRALI